MFLFKIIISVQCTAINCIFPHILTALYYIVLVIVHLILFFRFSLFGFINVKGGKAASLLIFLNADLEIPQKIMDNVLAKGATYFTKMLRIE